MRPACQSITLVAMATRHGSFCLETEAVERLNRVEDQGVIDCIGREPQLSLCLCS